MNPYLKALRKKYDQLRSSIEGLQTRAADEQRDLTEDELRSVNEQAEEAKKLAKQIEDLTEIETRNAQVAQLGADLAEREGGGEETRSLGGDRSNVQTRDRDPGHYRSVTEGGEHSFFGDIYHARANGDESAAKRLNEHNRALSTGAQGVGVVPPKWLTELFETEARQGRALAAAVRNIPLGDDPRPMTIPRQIAGTDSVVGEQANENDPVDGTDAWDSDAGTTVTPKPTSGKQTVSRQMVDMSNPAIDQLIYGDLLSVYNAQVENKVGAAVRAAGVLLDTVPEASFADMAIEDDNGSDLAVRLGIAVRKAHRGPADILAMTIDRYGEYLKLKDSTGRPLIPDETAGPMNVVGVGSVNVDGRIKRLGVVATDGMDDGTQAGGTGDPETDTFAALRARDVLLFESNVLRFRFEEVKGPESIVLGIWGYTAAHVRFGGATVALAKVTV